jgi:hypothetical protein
MKKYIYTITLSLILIANVLNAQSIKKDSVSFNLKSLEPSFELLFEPGMTLGTMPVVGLENGHLMTFGLEGTLFFTPLKTKYGSYSYFLSRTEGHFFSTANRFMSKGHRISIDFNKIKLIATFSNINRLYSSDLGEATNENVSRTTIGLGFGFDEYMIQLGFLREKYQEFPNDEWASTSFGGQAEFSDTDNNYAIQFELLPHPRFHANVLVSGLGDFTTSGYWSKLTVVKRLNVIKQFYTKWD